MRISNRQRKAYLYKIKNLSSGKIYIGVTTRCMKLRLKEHSVAKTTAIGKAIRSYGIDNFTITPLVIGMLNYVLNLEIDAVMVYNAHITRNGYNLTKGGEGHLGYSHTMEARKKIGVSSKKPKSKEMRKKLSESIRGHPVSAETRRKISEKLKGRKRSKDAIEKMLITRDNRTDEEKQKEFEARSKVWKGKKRKYKKRKLLNEEAKKKDK